MAGLLRLLKQKWNPPKPETSLFTGKTVLITGASTGLGLEAAKKIACLDPSILIITARSKERGERAKDIIERHAKQIQSSLSTSKLPQIHALPLNMSQFTHVTQFANQITSQFPTLDTVILNAGVASATWTTTPDGWEEQLQVNSLSTILLAYLLLPTLLSNSNSNTNTSPSNPKTKPHLTIVTSGLARLVAPASMQPYLHHPHPLRALNTKPTTTNASPLSIARTQYAHSKLLTELSTRHLATHPAITAGPSPPNVIINTTCPGLCATDLSRDMGTSFLLRLLLRVFYTLFARTAEAGSNSLVSGVVRGVEGHGFMWKDDAYLDSGVFLGSEEGRVWAGKVEREMGEVLGEWVPGNLKPGWEDG